MDGWGWGLLWVVVFAVTLSGWLLLTLWLARVDMRLALLADEVEDLTDDEDSRSDPLTFDAEGEWVPAIVKSGLLKRGWVTVDSDGKSWFWGGGSMPVFDGDKWLPHSSDGYDSRLYLKESPKVVGREAIWEVSDV